MMKMYIADAFTKELFKGNPAAVCFVDQWPSDDLMRKIAMENRFSETAFTIKQDDHRYGSPRAARSTSAGTPPWPQPSSFFRRRLLHRPRRLPSQPLRAMI